MMELLTRPFAAPLRLSTQRIIASSTKIDTGLAGFAIGKPGSIPSPEAFDASPPPLDGGGFKVIDCDHKFEEKGRTETPIKITNPDDTTQWVQTMRIDTIRFGEKSPDTFTFSYDKNAKGFFNPFRLSATCDLANGSDTVLNITPTTGLISGTVYDVIGAGGPDRAHPEHQVQQLTFGGGTGGTLSSPALHDATDGHIEIYSLGTAPDFAPIVNVVVDENKLCNNNYTLHPPA